MSTVPRALNTYKIQVWIDVFSILDVSLRGYFAPHVNEKTALSSLSQLRDPLGAAALGV